MKNLLFLAIMASFFSSCSRDVVYLNKPTYSHDSLTHNISAPKLTNNPTWDIIATNKRPLLSFFNAKGGRGERMYTIQLDTKKSFDSRNFIEYKKVPEENKYLTSKLVTKDLVDNTRYYWRVKAVDEDGQEGPFATSRFYIDTSSDKTFMNLIRADIKGIKVSSGNNPANIIDWDDPGQQSYWQSTPPGSKDQWVEFDLGERTSISRIWMLSNINSYDGWLKSFYWQSSLDGKNWKNIANTNFVKNDTYRNIINIDPTTGRYFRLYITDWYGYAAQINAIVLYSPKKPPIPKVPTSNYVLLVGDQMSGDTFTELKEYVEGVGLNLKAIIVPHFMASLEMVEKLSTKPVAIILSGNNAGYQNLPMFEYNGVYEIIRKCQIPILGICCGHQLTVMAYGYTYARSMGWEDITSIENYWDRTKIDIVKNDPIFVGIQSPFTAPEIHGWAVVNLPKDYEVLAKSTYIQAIKSKSKFLYGEQFHAEIKRPYNQAHPYLINFLKMAIWRSTGY
jgi:GMP synthase-like glutamine amidotransferase